MLGYPLSNPIGKLARTGGGVVQGGSIVAIKIPPGATTLIDVWPSLLLTDFYVASMTPIDGDVRLFRGDAIKGVANAVTGGTLYYVALGVLTGADESWAAQNLSSKEVFFVLNGATLPV